MGHRSWLIKVNNNEELHAIACFCKHVVEVSNVDNCPDICGGIKMLRDNGPFKKGDRVILLSTDGETCMSYLDHFGITEVMYRLENVETKIMSDGTRKVLGAKYYRSPKVLLDEFDAEEAKAKKKGLKRKSSRPKKKAID